MSYQSKMDKMIGKNCASYQGELDLNQQLHDALDRNHPYMPNGYPLVVYHPRIHRRLKTTQTRRHLSKPGDILSNGVPKVLSGELIEGYLLGIYNPRVL